MPFRFRLMVFAILFFGASFSFAQPAPGAAVNQDILGRIPERMRHFVDDKPSPGS